MMTPAVGSFMIHNLTSTLVNRGMKGPRSMPTGLVTIIALNVDVWSQELSALCRAVGSRTGAPTVGSGGSSKAFALGLSPAPLVTFPAPATSNPAYGFPVPGFPGCFAPRVMGPIRLGALSAAAGNHRAVAYSTYSAEAPTFSDSPRNARTVQPSPWRISSFSVPAD